MNCSPKRRQRWDDCNRDYYARKNIPHELQIFEFVQSGVNMGKCTVFEDLNNICNIISENNQYLEHGDMNQDNIIDSDDIVLIVDAILLND